MTNVVGKIEQLTTTSVNCADILQAIDDIQWPKPKDVLYVHKAEACIRELKKLIRQLAKAMRREG